ncbi:MULTISPECIES: hypothetical protein [unclassified Crossiella]|uniref:hypothetical protein n=1 Tax=unclassified Crossiella TaxID=2620835 RepID=UPI001FFFF149|nr:MULTISPECIES: hypothetical protein [unclassified Crossiella]MCK2244324.1 hypothetical protein [Crossiella sp. S99.2]MCK2257848.1 hypothetical protein [Crossiella sp. S99.1]
MSAKAPYGWLKGSFPRGQVPELVAAVLSDRLGTPVEVGHIWPGRRNQAEDPLPEGQINPPWHAEQVASSLRRLAVRRGTAAAIPPPLTGEPLLSVAVDWLTADNSPVRSRATGTEVTPAMLRHLALRAAQLRQLDESHGGLVVADWSSHDLLWVTTLINDGAYDSTLGRRLYQAAAELALIAGWVFSDHCRHGAGQRALLVGLRAAKLAGDRQLGAYILSCIAYHLTWHGHASDALRLLRIASKGLGRAVGGRVPAVLATRRARAHAQLGEKSACTRALTEAAASLDGARDTSEPPWSRWVSQAVLVADAGRAHLELGNPEKAEQNLMSSLRQLDANQRRNHLLHSTSLAQARLMLGQVDGAVAAARQALALTSTVESGRARQRLESLRRSLTGYDSALARASVEQIREVTACRL